METITIHKAKTQLSRLVEKAHRGGEIIIARGKEPMAKLVPLPKKKAKRSRTPGLWKGKIFCTPDAFDPLTGQELRDLGFE